MRKYVLGPVICLMSVLGAEAQERAGLENILEVVGVTEPEQLDEEEYERLSTLLSHPLEINRASSSRLTESGLFTRFQIASILDYRMRHGDILSLSELASVDGFDREKVRMIAPFISVSSRMLPGERHGGKPDVDNSLAVRTGLKAVRESSLAWNYGLKYKIDAGDVLQGSLAFDRPNSAGTPAPSAYSGNLIWHFRKIGGKFIVGDFNARFGQGLALWNGMFMTSLTSPDAFMKRPSGLSGVWSFTGSSAMRGLAAEFGAGKFTFSVLAAHKGIWAANVAWSGRSGQLSLTGRIETGTVADRLMLTECVTSLDAAFCVKGVNIFGEAAWNWISGRLSAVAGTEFRAATALRMAALARCIDRDRYGAAVSGKLDLRRPAGIHKVLFSIDSEYYATGRPSVSGAGLRIKGQASWDYTGENGLVFRSRLTERFQTWGELFRTDLRADIGYSGGPLTIIARLNALICDGVGTLAYVEGGWKKDTFSIYLRQGVFLVDKWEDRIYVYERDAPGSFNVPAMYGRGVWTSLVAGCRLGRIARLYVRAAYTGYPFMAEETKKPGRAELKLQCVFRF